MHLKSNSWMHFGGTSTHIIFFEMLSIHSPLLKSPFKIELNHSFWNWCNNLKFHLVSYTEIFCHSIIAYKLFWILRIILNDWAGVSTSLEEFFYAYLVVTFKRSVYFYNIIAWIIVLMFFKLPKLEKYYLNNWFQFYKIHLFVRVHNTYILRF